MSDVKSAERQLGVDLFNETWRLIESREDDVRLVNCAHASAYHWSVASECKPENIARAEWLLSRVYTVVGRAPEAQAHAGRCLEVCEQSGLADWDLGFAYEALARAARLAGDDGGAARFIEHARGVEVADAEDRKLLEQDLATL
jgi:hypothetical protein